MSNGFSQLALIGRLSNSDMGMYGEQCQTFPIYNPTLHKAKTTAPCGYWLSSVPAVPNMPQDLQYQGKRKACKHLSDEIFPEIRQNHSNQNANRDLKANPNIGSSKVQSQSRCFGQGGRPGRRQGRRRVENAEITASQPVSTNILKINSRGTELIELGSAR